jgi:hypothetical protein
MNRVALSLVVLLLGSAAPSAASTPIFEIKCDDVRGGGRVCNVTFFNKVPPAHTVDKILRNSLELAILVDPSRDILAMAFGGDTELSSNQYSGALVYRAAQKRIMPSDDAFGVKTTSRAAPGYFVVLKEDRTAEGITPVRKFLMMTLVFPKTPTRDLAYKAMLTEVERIADRGLDVNAYVMVGNKADPTTWQQMKDTDGAHIFANYEASSRQVTRKEKLLKKLR